MSLESKIEALTAAVAQLTAVMHAGNATVQQAAPVVQAPPAAAPVVPVAPPVVAPVVAAMPAPPTFAAAPAPVAPAAPFATPQELMQYVMTAYQAMGPAKGAQIQQILTHLGCTNINEVKPEQYGQLHTHIEQLKAS